MSKDLTTRLATFKQWLIDTQQMPGEDLAEVALVQEAIDTIAEDERYVRRVTVGSTALENDLREAQEKHAELMAVIIRQEREIETLRKRGKARMSNAEWSRLHGASSAYCASDLPSD